MPLVGSRKRAQLAEVLGALGVKLAPDTLAALAQAMPPEAVAGEHYPASQLVHMDSEKGRVPA